MLSMILNQLCKPKIAVTFIFRTVSVVAIVSGFAAMPANAALALYTLTMDQNFVEDAHTPERFAGQVGSVHLEDTTVEKYYRGMLIDVAIPGGKVARGVVTRTAADATPPHAAALADERLTIISLSGNAGSVEISSDKNSITGLLLHDTAAERIYSAQISASGDGRLELMDNNDYYCVKYPQPDLLNSATRLDPQPAELIPDISTLRNLQSRPGASNVLFIDYWGGILANSYWNANYTSNAPINYTPYDTDFNPGNFSSTERYSMWLAWREAVEDFAPFNINITTSRAVYDAAAITNRAQMIVTTTRDWYSSSAGGVALINIFDDDSEYYKAAWTWNLSESSMGMTISHEAGHQLGLSHDGVGTQGYYRGHGVWGPIMGAPFGKSYVQWSKGEYPDANQFEDDIAKVTGKLGLIADDAANAYANATGLNLPVNNKKGLVSYQDPDAYTFSLSAPAAVEIKVISLLGDENESRAANLSMDVSLVKINSSGGVVSSVSMTSASDISPLSPSTNKFVYSSDLSSGSYALRITPSSPDTNPATGFGNYGNAGEYRLSVSAQTGGGIKTVGKPVIDRQTDTGIFIWQKTSKKWVVNVVSADGQRVVEVDVLSQQPLSDVLPLNIEPNDVFTHLDNSLEMVLRITPPWMDGAEFRVDEQSGACFSTANPNLSIYLGPERVEMPGAFDLNTLGDCLAADINTVGKPVIDRETDTGIFIWQKTSKKWVVNVVSADQQRVVEVDVQSQQPLSDIFPLNIEPNDVFTQLPNGLDMVLRVTPPWMDGAEFRAQEQSGTCISTTSIDVPIYVGPQRINAGADLDLDTLMSCQ